MNAPRLKKLLCLEAVLCLAAALLLAPSSRAAQLPQFPFVQLAQLIRLLNNSGAAGPAVAWLLYLLLGLLPLGAGIILWRTGRLSLTDLLLPLQSAYLFYLLYQLINPGKLQQFGLEDASFTGSGLCVIFWSLLTGWLLLRFLRYCRRCGDRQLGSCMSWLFAILAIISTAALFDAQIMQLRSTLAEQSSAVCVIATLLIFLCQNLATAIQIIVLYQAAQLADRLREDRFSAATVTQARRLARYCLALATTAVLSSPAANLLYLAFAPYLNQIDINVNLPLFAMAVAVSLLLLARLISDSNDLKQDNELII